MLQKAEHRREQFEGGKVRGLDEAKRSLVSITLRFTLLHKALYSRLPFDAFLAGGIIADLQTHLADQRVAPTIHEILMQLVACSMFVVQRVHAPRTPNH